MVIVVDDEDTMITLRLFKERIGQEYSRIELGLK